MLKDKETRYPSHTEIAQAIYLIENILWDILDDLDINTSGFSTQLEKNNWDIVFVDDYGVDQIYLEYKSSINEWGKQVDAYLRQVNQRKTYGRNKLKILFSFDPEFEKFRNAFERTGILLIILNENLLKTTRAYLKGKITDEDVSNLVEQKKAEKDRIAYEKELEKEKKELARIKKHLKEEEKRLKKEKKEKKELKNKKIKKNLIILGVVIVALLIGISLIKHILVNMPMNEFEAKSGHLDTLNRGYEAVDLRMHPEEVERILNGIGFKTEMHKDLNHITYGVENAIYLNLFIIFNEVPYYSEEDGSYSRNDKAKVIRIEMRRSMEINKTNVDQILKTKSTWWFFALGFLFK